MTARHAWAAGILMATLALIAFVAWQPGAKAVHDAPQPTPAPCPAPTPGDHTLTIDTPEGQRQVLLHAPPGANKPRPLVIALHGAGETGSDFANDTGFSRLADREGFLVAYPSAGGPNSFWNLTGQAPGASDVEALERSLDQLEAAGCVDPARVFVTGVSNGGGMTARLACDLSERLAGVASVAGGYRSLPACKPERPLPVLEIHGTADQVVPYGGKPPDFNGAVKRWLWQWRRIDGCQGNADRLNARVRRDRDRLAPLHRRDARRARAPRRPGPRLAGRPADRSRRPHPSRRPGGRGSSSAASRRGRPAR